MTNGNRHSTFVNRHSPRRPFVVGIGGSAGAGKSVLARYLARQGAQLIDADRIGWSLLFKDAPTYPRLVRAFGTRILDARGNIRRRVLGDIVFSSPPALARLNRIVHPALLAELRRQVGASRKPVVVIDAALLFHWRLNRQVDLAVLVTAAREKKLARMVKTGIPRRLAVARLGSQTPEVRLRKLADVVIANNGTPAELRRTARKLWQLLTRELLGIM